VKLGGIGPGTGPTDIAHGEGSAANRWDGREIEERVGAVDDGLL